MWYGKEKTEIYQNHNFLWYIIINKHKDPIAQLVEHKVLNLVVIGSSPMVDVFLFPNIVLTGPKHSIKNGMGYFLKKGKNSKYKIYLFI